MSTEILDVVALSPLQRGLYSVSTMSGPVDPYLVTFAVRIDGLDDPATVRTAFDRVLARYPHLGASVVADGLPHPVLLITTSGSIGWREVDLRDRPDPAAAARELYWDEGRTRIDLANGPLFRVVAARIGERSWELICTAHHIVVDGWSIPLIFADLVALHRGEGAALPQPPALREHAAWLASRDTDASIAAWAASLADAAPMPMIGPPAPTELDHPVLGEAQFDTAETELVTGWARRRGLTLNTVLQMSWGRVLSGLTGRDDVVFGQTTSGRDSSLPNAERLVGALVTTIPVRVRMDEREPAQIGTQLQRDVAQLRPHEYVGIAEITRHAGIGQLFDTLLVFENTPTGALTGAIEMGGGARLQARRVDSPSHYPIAVVPVVESGRLISRVEIRPDMVSRFEPDRLARRLLTVLRRMVAAERGCDVDVLLDDEPAALSGPAPQPAAVDSVPDAVLRTAERLPERIAVIDSAGTHTFDEFAAAVRTLAVGLRAHGVHAGAAVAVVLPRDRRVLFAPFAIGYAGGVTVHVDPATPADRLGYMLRTTGAHVVLGDASLAGVIDEVRESGVDCVHAIPDNAGRLRVDGETVSAPAQNDLPCDPASPFYVVFTSGTTGRPKGVAVSHAALLNHWGNHERRIFAPAEAQTARQLRIGHGWSTGFDAAWQPSVALLSGHAVVLLGDEVRTDAERIVDAIDEHRIDIFDTSPSMLNRLVAAGLFTENEGVEQCPLRVLALGGEAITPDTWRRLQRLPDTRVINFYGPTEATVEALLADVHEHTDPTIGRPFDGMRAEVLDHRLRPVPPGGQGELYLSGPQLAVGYLGRPAATAAAFVAGPAQRRYRTGDLVRRTAEQTVVYEGRVDNQVKINGYRVEPAETAVVLRELDGISHAEAVAYTDNGRLRLGALVVSELTTSEIRTALLRRLPQFLVPTRIAHVDRIPLNRNDKLDVHIAVDLLTEAVPSSGSATPSTDTERELLDLIGATLGAEASNRIGILDSLVDLGIDSIGVIDLVSRLRGAGYRVSAQDVVTAADLRELAHRMENPTVVETAAAAVAEPGTVSTLTPLAREIIGHGNFRPLAQSQVLELPGDVDVDTVIARLEALALAHPALRSRLIRDEDGTPVLITGASAGVAELVRVVAQESAPVADHLRANVDLLDPEAGRMVAATVLTTGASGSRLLLSIHHLAVDVVSWLILLDDLRVLQAGEQPANETPAESVEHVAAPPRSIGRILGERATDPARDRAEHAEQLVVELDAERTGALLRRCHDSGVPLDDALIVAAASVFSDTADDAGAVAITRETHGRAADDDSRRVGWFTVEETCAMPASAVASWSPASGVPQRHQLGSELRAQIRLNHLGRFDLLQYGSGPWTPAPLAEFAGEFGVRAHPDLPLRFTADITTVVVPRADGPTLVAQFDFNTAVLDDSEVRRRTDGWSGVLVAFADGSTAGAHHTVFEENVS